jgi:hypothetical protein
MINAAAARSLANSYGKADLFRLIEIAASHGSWSAIVLTRNPEGQWLVDHEGEVRSLGFSLTLVKEKRSFGDVTPEHYIISWE